MNLQGVVGEETGFCFKMLGGLLKTDKSMSRYTDFPFVVAEGAVARLMGVLAVALRQICTETKVLRTTAIRFDIKACAEIASWLHSVRWSANYQ